MNKNTHDQVLGHSAEADGIEEYDNPLPTWWLGLFYVCIGWGVVYAVDYHFVSHRSQAGEYNAENQAYLEQHPQPAGVMVAQATPEALAAGKEVFAANCVACHGAEAKGGIGPDLTDATWIHGGTVENITTTITNGVPEKGMITWGPILGPEKISKVGVYVHSLGGGQ